MDEPTLRRALLRAWSIDTSSLWAAENPARGQCGVTAFVVRELLGGEVLKTPLPAGWHFYNRLEGRRVDFTDSQFDRPIEYKDLPSSEAEAFADTGEAQVRALRERLARELRRLRRS